MSYFIHDTLWAYPSVIHLKKLMLLTFSFYTSFGRRLTSPKGTRADKRSAVYNEAAFKRRPERRETTDSKAALLSEMVSSINFV